MMNMSHEGRINALFVLSPWQHLQLFVSTLVPNDFESTVRPLLAPQEPLRGCEISLEFYSNLTKCPTMDCLSQINIASSMLGWRWYLPIICALVSLFHLTHFHVVFQVHAKNPQIKNWFCLKFCNPWNWVGEMLMSNSVVFLERTQVHFPACSMSVQSQLPVTPATGHLMPSSGFPGCTSTYVTHSTLSQTHTYKWIIFIYALIQTYIHMDISTRIHKSLKSQNIRPTQGNMDALEKTENPY